MNFNSSLEYYYSRIERALESIIASQKNTIPENLYSAMRYTITNGGKRLRPLLTYFSGKMLNALEEDLDITASAIELIHTYSLIHDDLPSMDNAELRRGKKTCHLVYGEATAILAGDALLTLAFEMLAKKYEKTISENQLKMISLLAQSIGADGMVGGQILDLELNQSNPDIKHLEKIHQNKTGKLITSCLIMGALTANCHDQFTLTKLQNYGDALGLAFQIQDDVLDIESSEETLGKSIGKDAELRKKTYPKLVGIDAAKQKIQELFNFANNEISQLNYDSHLLQEFSKFLIHRVK